MALILLNPIDNHCRSDDRIYRNRIPFVYGYFVLVEYRETTLDCANLIAIRIGNFERVSDPLADWEEFPSHGVERATRVDLDDQRLVLGVPDSPGILEQRQIIEIGA